MVFLLLTLLFITLPGSRDAVMSMFGGERADFWFTMTIIGAVLLLLTILVENAHGVALRRDVTRHESKINELKAKLYDHQLDQRDREARVGGTTVVRPEQVVVTPVAQPVAQPVPVPQPAPNTIPRAPFTAPPTVVADDLPTTSVPPPSAADLPPTSVPPTTVSHNTNVPPTTVPPTTTYPNDAR
jgi:hypothetical protein